MSLPAEKLEASEILRRLERSFPDLAKLRGSGGWIVGGAIRDVLLGREVTDVDLVFQSAEQAARSFAAQARARTIVLGRPGVEAHRVTSRGRAYDFAELTRGSIDADLSRRDFTLNAIALSLDRPEIVDPFDGRADLEASLVRQINARNFEDDPLRTLKGVRMAVALGFELEADTRDAIEQHAARIQSVAAERVASELRLIAAAGLGRGVALMKDTKLLDALELQTSDTAIDRLDRIRTTDSTTALSALVVELDKTAIARFAERWKLSASERQTFVVQRELLDRISGREFEDACAMRIAIYDAGAEEAERFGKIAVAANLSRSNDWAALVRTDLAAILQCDGLLNGDELRVRFGFEGKEIGKWKRRLLERQICGLTTTRQAAIEFIELSLK